MLKLNLTKTSLNFLKDLQPKQFKQVTIKLLELTTNPTPNDYIKMSGPGDFYRVDAGEYRIVYKFDKEVVEIYVVGKRNDDDAYKQAKRKR